MEDNYSDKLTEQEAFSTIHDLILGMYEVKITLEQSNKIYHAVETESDFSYDTDQRDELLDDLCTLFGLDIKFPTYGSTEEYKSEFEEKLQQSKTKFLEFIK